MTFSISILAYNKPVKSLKAFPCVPGVDTVNLNGRNYHDLDLQGLITKIELRPLEGDSVNMHSMYVITFC